MTDEDQADRTVALNNAASRVRELRKFGRSLAMLLALFFGVLLPWLFSYPWPVWPWLLALPVWIVAETAPGRLDKLEIAWLKLGELLGHVVSPLLLALVYILLITPLGWLKRVLGRSRLKLYRDDDCDTYREAPPVRTRLEDPF